MQGSIVTLLIIGHPKAIIARRSDFLRISLRDRGVIAHLAFEAYCLEIDRQPQRGACKIDRRAIWDPRFPQRTGIPFPLATISTRSASLVRKSESGTREGAKTDARLEEEEASIATSIRSVLFIYRCLPTCASYRPQHSANRRLRATATRNATSNRIGPFLPSFLTGSSVFWVSKVAAARSRELAVENPFQELGQQLASTRPLRDERLWRIFRIRIRRNDPPRRKLEYETNIVALRSPIDRSIHPSTNRPSKPAKPTALYFALEKYPVSRIEQKRLLSLGERPRSVIINDPIHRLGFASHWFVTRARVSPRVEKFFARCVPNISVRSSIVAR